MPKSDEVILLVAMLKTLALLIDKQCEALNLQTGLLEDLVRGQDIMEHQLRALTVALAAPPVH
jgi:hypothetical protein